MKRFSLVLPMVLLLSGCPKGTQSLATASDTIAHAVRDAQIGVTDACQANPRLMNVDTCDNFQRDFVKIARAGKILDNAIRANQSPTMVAPLLNSFLIAFHQLNDNDLTGIRDQHTRLAIGAILTGAEAAVSVIAAEVGNRNR